LARGPDDAQGAGDLALGRFEERFALRRTNCCSASRVWFFERGRAACKEIKLLLLMYLEGYSLLLLGSRAKRVLRTRRAAQCS
jgi:hypothetical protein